MSSAQALVLNEITVYVPKQYKANQRLFRKTE